MILIISPSPHGVRVRDGAYQRYSWIDNLIEDFPRTYLDISFLHYLSATEVQKGNVTTLELNLFFHLPRIIKILRSASIIYVHSVFQSLKVLPIYWMKFVVTDMHGVVPEELRLSGGWWSSKFFGVCERIVIKKSAVVVLVTSAMQKHFEKKYKISIRNSCVIPILPAIESDKILLDSNRSANCVIYSGGTQAWQNVSKMLDIVDVKKEFSFIFLSNDAEIFEAHFIRTGARNVVCRRVNSSEVESYYELATFGLILRDDIVVNRVACPTKLIEYLHCGIIPIVLSPEIGDFIAYKYRYITIEDFSLGKIPSPSDLLSMRQHNFQIVSDMYENSKKSTFLLRQFLTSGVI